MWRIHQGIQSYFDNVLKNSFFSMGTKICKNNSLDLFNSIIFFTKQPVEQFIGQFLKEWNLYGQKFTLIKFISSLL